MTAANNLRVHIIQLIVQRTMTAANNLRVHIGYNVFGIVRDIVHAVITFLHLLVAIETDSQRPAAVNQQRTTLVCVKTVIDNICCR